MVALKQATSVDITGSATRIVGGVSVDVVPSNTRSVVGGVSKRTLDIVLALMALVVFAPLFVMIAVVMRFIESGPVLYGHARVGAGGRKFLCLKFRTMAVDGDRILAEHLAANASAKAEWDETRKLRRDPRVTPLGKVMRASSIDELPQLINVLKGEMSFVGPRPVVADELELYGHNASLYLATRPGITGLWQVSGRSETTYEERVALDSHYVANWSLRRDLSIIMRTVPAVLSARGSY